MRWLVLASLCGCNWAFGVREARDRDAEVVFFDRPIDAPPQCPPIGTAPQFSPQVHQIFAKPCVNYMVSTAANRALTKCPELQGIVEEGPVDGEVAPAIGFPDLTTSTVLDVMLAPEGDTALVREVINATGMYELNMYVRGSSGTWSKTTTLPFGTASSRVSNASRAPLRHVLVYEFGAGITEWVSDATGTWSSLPTVSEAELGANQLDNLRLSPDATRLVFYGLRAGDIDLAINYLDRPSASAAWNPTVHVMGVSPDVSDAFMTEDCGRLYFSGLASIFYSEQL